MQRRIEIVECNFGMSASEFQEKVNDKFKEIMNNDGEILKTEYCITTDGHIRCAIIEFEY